jgi:hypothetical protein
VPRRGIVMDVLELDWFVVGIMVELIGRYAAPTTRV